MLSDRGIIMNAKPKIAIGVLAVLLVAAIILGAYFTRGKAKPPTKTRR